jgi:hypothetical protein
MKLLLLTLAIAAQTADAQHQHGSGHEHSSIEARGNEAMGFNQQKTRHNFLLREDGGLIRVVAGDARDKASVEQVRYHLKEIAASFKAGDFEKPSFIHAKNPPGVATMKRLKGEISYAYRTIENGAEIVIATQNKEGRKAIRDFFRMQIEDHGTADPLP